MSWDGNHHYVSILDIMQIPVLRTTWCSCSSHQCIPHYEEKQGMVADVGDVEVELLW